MYPVSEAFLSAVQENTRRYYWTGKITTKTGVVHEFSEKEIVKGSGYISAQCCGNAEMELGTMYAAEIGITLFLSVDRYSLDGATVELFYHLCLADGTYESIPMGVYEVSEANRMVKCLELKAYDYMLRFEENFSGTSTAGTAYEIIMLCCGACHVEFAQTQEEIDAMPNGTEILSVYSDNDIETYRDVLYYIGQVLGGFFVINREGKLELRKYGNEPVMEITQKQRFSSSFSDFITRYTAISSTNLRTQTAEYYALETDDGLTMNLGSNPFLQFGLEETRKTLCENILADISVIAYVPFDSETIGNPALDLGDVIRFSGGHADGEQITCITSIQCKIGGKQTLKCVGKNPRLSQAKSKNDKNLVGLLNQIDEGKVGFFSFTNAKAFELGETEVEVISIDFTAGEVTQAEFIGLVVMDVVAEPVTRESAAVGTITVPVPVTATKESDNTGSSEGETVTETETGEEIGTREETGTEDVSETVDVSVEVNLPVKWEEDGKAVVRARYSLNDTDIDLFYPTQTYGTGRYTFPLYYPVNNVIPNLLNNFKVYFSVSGGTVMIEKGCCIATVTGQGLAAEAAAEWNGTLTIEDTIQKYHVLHWLEPGQFVDRVTIEKDSPDAYQISQKMRKLAMTGFSMIFEEGSEG